MSIVLYQLEQCPSCAEVREWLGRHRIDYSVHNVPKLHTERAEVLALCELAEVPVLQDGEVVLQGAEAILAHLTEEVAQPGFGEPTYGLTRNLGAVSVEDARSAVIEALAAEGFGVLTEIDVKKTLKKRLGVQMAPYLILGACNPPLAHEALSSDPAMGLLLPCNVVLAADPDGTTVVSAVDPYQMLSVTGRQDLGAFAREVKARLSRVLASL